MPFGRVLIGGIVVVRVVVRIVAHFDNAERSKTPGLGLSRSVFGMEGGGNLSAECRYDVVEQR